MSDTNAAIERAAKAIEGADALLIGAGAGMGVDSGLPDFRGNEGFWQAYPPFKKLGLSFVQLANPGWFISDPSLAWGFYGHRRQLYRETKPHRGFEILRRWADKMPAGAFVFTSNIDGHFQKAGFAAERLVECHGSLDHLQCSKGCKGIWTDDGLTVAVDLTTFRAQQPLPLCPVCDQTARPNVLMFGDYDFLDDRLEQQGRRYLEWLEQAEGRRLTIVEIGAGTAVPTVRYECERQPGTLIRINPREAHGPDGMISLPLGALDALSKIDNLLDADAVGP